MFAKLFASATTAHAHCDLYCGVYDPAQAKIEAMDNTAARETAEFIRASKRGICRSELSVG